jgi:hypothetical protein
MHTNIANDLGDPLAISSRVKFDYTLNLSLDFKIFSNSNTISCLFNFQN